MTYFPICFTEFHWNRDGAVYILSADCRNTSEMFTALTSVPFVSFKTAGRFSGCIEGSSPLL